jgi:hypothetical protein
MYIGIGMTVELFVELWCDSTTNRCVFSRPQGRISFPSLDRLIHSSSSLCSHCLPLYSLLPSQPSWDAFRRAGWKLRFLDDYLKRGMIKNVNPNQHGMVESIVCSKAKAFAGTYYSTFTGYIHRLRGEIGLFELAGYQCKRIHNITLYALFDPHFTMQTPCWFGFCCRSSRILLNYLLCFFSLAYSYPLRFHNITHTVCM